MAIDLVTEEKIGSATPEQLVDAAVKILGELAEENVVEVMEKLSDSDFDSVVAAVRREENRRNG